MDHRPGRQFRQGEGCLKLLTETVGEIDAWNTA